MTTLAYLDTNALVKLYLPEEGGQQVIDLLDEVDGVVTSVLSYPETLSVFARALDRGLITEERYDLARQEFEEDWTMALRIEMVEAVYRRAGSLMKHQPKLRTLDALHLSSALEARQHYDLQFLTFDKALRAAAIAILGQAAVV